MSETNRLSRLMGTTDEHSFSRALFDYLESNLCGVLGQGRVFHSVCEDLGDRAVVFELTEQEGLPRRHDLTVHCVARAANDALAIRDEVTALLDRDAAFLMGGFGVYARQRQASFRGLPQLDRYETELRFTLYSYEREGS